MARAAACRCIVLCSILFFTTSGAESENRCLGPRIAIYHRFGVTAQRLETRAGQAFRANKLRQVSNFEQSDCLLEIYDARSTVSFVRALPHEAKPGQMTVGTRPFALLKTDRFNSEI